MTAETHPDPFQDAIGNGVQRAVQVTSCAVTAAQVYLHQQRAQAMATAERDERARRALTAQMRADREAARASLGTRAQPRLAPRRGPAPDRPHLGRGDAIRRPISAVVRTRRRDRHAQMRRTAPRTAPIRHGPLRPATPGRQRTGRRDARCRAFLRQRSPGIRPALRATASAGRW